MVIGAIQGDGGPIYWLSMALTDAIVGTSKKDACFVVFFWEEGLSGLGKLSD